jgi:hypothetical protein
MLPRANTGAMQMHLHEISRNVAARAHAVVLMDRAGWHMTEKLKVPKNLTIILLPSRAPELNPVENVWQYLRQNWLSNCIHTVRTAVRWVFRAATFAVSSNADYAARVSAASVPFQFQGRSWSRRRAGCSAMRASTSASQA